MSGFSVFQDVQEAPVLSLSSLPSFNTSRLQNMVIDPDLERNSGFRAVLQWDGEMWTGGSGSEAITNVDLLTIGYPGVLAPQGSLIVAGQSIFGLASNFGSNSAIYINTASYDWAIHTQGLKRQQDEFGRSYTYFDNSSMSPNINCNFTTAYNVETQFFVPDTVTVINSSCFRSAPVVQSTGTINNLSGFYADVPTGVSLNINNAYGGYFNLPNTGTVSRNALYADNICIGITSVSAPTDGLRVKGFAAFDSLSPNTAICCNAQGNLDSIGNQSAGYVLTSTGPSTQPQFQSFEAITQSQSVAYGTLFGGEFPYDTTLAPFKPHDVSVLDGPMLNVIRSSYPPPDWPVLRVLESGKYNANILLSFRALNEEPTALVCSFVIGDPESGSIAPNTSMRIPETSNLSTLNTFCYNAVVNLVADGDGIMWRLSSDSSAVGNITYFSFSITKIIT